MNSRCFKWAIGVCVLVSLVAALALRFGGRAGPAVSGNRGDLHANAGIEREGARTTQLAECNGLATGDAAADAVSALADAAVRDGRRAVGQSLAHHTYTEIAKEQQRKEDAVFGKMPKYATVRETWRKKAQETIDGMPASSAASIINAAQRELDDFWRLGGLESEKAYEHAYLAWALTEIGQNEYPNDFEMLCALKEAACTTSPFYDADTTVVYEDSFDAVWPIVERQYELVTSGAVVPSPSAMMAVHDWCSMVPRVKRDLTAAVPGWLWLVSHAKESGLERVAPQLETGLRASQAGSMSLLCPYVIRPTRENMKNGDVFWLLDSQRQRRVPSFAGSRGYRDMVEPAWAVSDAPD